MTEKTESLPYGIGNFTLGWFVIVIVLLALVNFGGFGYIYQLWQGESVTGLRNVGSMNGATWGLYVAMYIYLMGLGFAGITFSAIVRLTRSKVLKPVTRIAEVMTVFASISGALLMIVDVGKPGRVLIKLLMYARPQSPLFVTFASVTVGYLFASLVYLYLAGRKDAAELAKKGGRFSRFHRLWAAGYQDTPAEQERRRKSSFWLAVAIVPLMVMASSTLGFVFSLQAGRPGWFRVLQPLSFVILAGLSGVGMLVLIAALLKKFSGLGEYLKDETFIALANIMMVLNMIYIFFTLVEWIFSFFSAHQSEKRTLIALIAGDYALLFWVTVICFGLPMALLVMQFITNKFSFSLIVVSALLLNLASVGKRYLIVVPSQTHGMLLPYGIGSYSPTWVEYAVVLGLFALAVLLYMFFVKIFPILEVKSAAEGGS